MTTYFIVNPLAGAGKAKSAVPLIEKEMQNSGKKYAVVHTNRPDDIERITGLIDVGDAEAIVCVGGDGTIQEYVGLAAGCDIKFGVIPAGSANDLLLSVPGSKCKFRSFNEKIIYYVNRVIAGETVYIDAICVNEKRYSINIAGTGIDIQVLRDALPLKKYFGGAAYLLALIANTVRYKAMEMTLTIDGSRETGDYLLIAVSNGAYYGGRLRIAPSAVVNDGKITLCKVAKMPRPKIALIFPLVKPGWHTGLKEYSNVDCEKIRLDFTGKKIINLDGNLVEYESPLIFEIKKNAVKFIV